MKGILKKILVILSIFVFMALVVALIFFVVGPSPEYMLSNEAVFYSVNDIENEYLNNKEYKGFMIVDESDDKYIFSTIEDYVEAKVGIGSDCIVSGIFFDDDRFVYEIAVFDKGNYNDPDYYLLDTKYAVLYEMETLVPVVEDENMINELNTIEKEYGKLQEKNMTKYEDTKILKYDYVKLMVEELASKEGIKYDDYKNMGIVNKDNVYYYQFDFIYNNEDSIYLVNANTCDMIRIK